MGRGTWRWIAVAAALLAATLGIRWLADTAPESDFALIDLSVFRVFHGWQAVGAYSRLGWFHPGPLYFQLLAPLYELSGHRHLSVVVTVAAINGACLIAIAAMLRRYNGALTAAAICWMSIYVVRLDGVLASPWNPYVALLPLAFLIVSAAAAASGAYRLLPLVVGVASFVVQTHVGFTAPAVAAVAVTAVTILLDALVARRQALPLDKSLTRSIGLAALVGCLVWLVPTIDDVRPGGVHNLRNIAAYFTHAVPHDARLAMRAFAHTIVAPLTPNLRLWGDAPLSRHDAAVKFAAEFQAVALIVAVVLFTRRRQRFESRLALIALGSSLAGLIAVRRIPEAPLEYTLMWVTMLGVVNWIVVTGLLLQLVSPMASRWIGRLPRLTSARVTAVIVLIVLAECSREVIALRAGDVRVSSRTRRLAEIVRLKAREAGATDPLVLVPQAFWGVATGVVLQLRLAGLSPHVERGRVAMFGQDCAPTGQERMTVALAEFEDHTQDLRNRSNYDELGAAGGVFVYAVEPPPDSTVVPPPLNVVDHSVSVVDPQRISDGETGTEGDSTSPFAVTFPGSAEYATVELPAARVVGVRLFGQPGSTWQLRCAKPDSEFARIGRVTIGERSGESFLRTLDGCRLLKISPAVDGDWIWLSELQVLTPAPAIKRP